jgi:hypothetical protein
MANTRMTAGANDYCSVPTTTDAYGGFYWSSDGGASWTDSLLPGYPTDTSAEGSNCDISPQHCLVINTGDPVQAFDRWGHVFYGVIGFNRVRPASGSIFAARYDWPMPSTVPDYRWTALVSRGTPSPLFRGIFNDKIGLEVDRGVNSPTRATRRGRGGTSTSAGPASPRVARTTACSSAARPTADGRTATRRRSPTACTAVSRATSLSPRRGRSTSRGGSSSSRSSRRTPS